MRNAATAATSSSFGSDQDTAVRHGRLVDMARRAHQIVTINAWVGENESVLIVYDHEVSPMIVEALAMQVAVVGGVPLLLRMPPQTVHGAEPPDAVAQAMLGADVVFGVVSRSITHTLAAQESRARGVRYIGFSNITEDAFIRGAAAADPEDMQRVGSVLRDRLMDCSDVRVTNPNGTDVRFSLAGRRIVIMDGVLPKVNPEGLSYLDNKRMFPDGEVFTCPVEESTEGVIVVDRWMQGIGILDEPIRWTFRSGRCIAIEGGEQAVALDRLINEEGDDYSRYLGEFAIGINRLARSDGNPHREGKKVYGSVHFALGTGTATGGKYQSTLHLDGTMTPPKIYADGVLIMDEGTLAQ